MRAVPHRRRRSRGQAMIEYSMIVWALVLVLVLGMTTTFPGMKQNILEAMLDAYQKYYDSYYYVLNLPFP